MVGWKYSEISNCGGEDISVYHRWLADCRASRLSTPSDVAKNDRSATKGDLRDGRNPKEQKAIVGGITFFNC
jgi:hypothetical protein